MCSPVLTELLVFDTGVVVDADETFMTYLIVVVCINQTKVDTGVVVSANQTACGRHRCGDQC